MIRSTSRLSRIFLQSSALASIFAAAISSAAADTPSVVTTIKPVHSIASAVMDGVGKPLLLIDGAASPHGFALKPSQAILLQGADIVFWVGPGLETSLAKPISSMAADATVIEMMGAADIEHLGLREGEHFDAHDHSDHAGHDHDDHKDHDHDKHAEHDHDDHKNHDHDKHAGHDHDDHKDHDHDKHAGHDHDDHKDHDHDKHDDHDHDDHKDHDHDKHARHDHDHSDEKDVHIWLNPDNGIAIAAQMAKTLSEIDPPNASTYKANAEKFAEQLEALEHEVEEKLEPVTEKPFIVFHDAYHHFEHHFGIETSGAITLTPETIASAEQIKEIRAKISDLGVVCVFQEPQFEAKLVNVVIEGSNANIGTLDPLGASLENGKDLYPNLISNLANSLHECLSK